MTSYLETIPRDVLQHIAFLSGSSSVLEPPVGIYNLLQTSSIIYQSLNVHSSPHIYSQIFSAKFDTRAHRRRYQGQFTDSALVAELVSRLRLLRRSRRMDLSPDGLMQDLWTALWMVLENDSLNEQQLCASGFTRFLSGLARVKLTETNPKRRTDSDELKFIVIWLLCLTLSQQTILDMSEGRRDELYGLIFPYIFMDKQGMLGNPHTPGDSSGHVMPAYVYLRRQLPLVPDPAIAAIYLTFRLLEINSIQVPTHLPETRAIANATLRSGPTREDYRVMVSYKTSLSSRTLAQDHSTNNDMFFGAILRSLGDVQCTETFTYTPGTMSGLWEGVFRILNMPTTNVESAAHSDTLFSLSLIYPMQCSIAEYLCSDFGTQCNPLDRDILDSSDVCSPYLCNGHDTEVVFNGWNYKKHSIQAGTIGEVESRAQEAPSFRDIMLLGQTLDDHDQAWGGYKFLGRVTNDGRVLLKRERKYSDEQQGVWIFNGQLRSESLLLGRWRVAGNPSAFDQGVFSMGKARGR